MKGNNKTYVKLLKVLYMIKISMISIEMLILKSIKYYLNI